MRILNLLLLFILVCVTGCKNFTNTDKSTVFFGGEIINPKGDKVILYNRTGDSSDTLKLDKQNRFGKTFNNLKPGQYTFWHGGEIQFVILEPNDSIMFRLNTYDFDKSLVFSGRGSKKNNYLIKTFLSNEDNSKRLVNYSNQEPEDFEKRVNERHLKELEYFENFKNNTELSPLANSIIKANIDYHNYADKEIYPFAYFGENKLVHLKDLPKNFYDFRSKVDYNASHLSETFAYKRYLVFHFDNMAVTNFYKTNDFHSKFNRYELSYNKAKLKLVDSLVKDETIKNNILKYKTREFINNSDNRDEIDEIMASYLSKTTNEEDIKQMNTLIASLDNLKPGKGLPDLKLIDVNNSMSTIAEIVEKPTLIYFWSSNEKMHYKDSHYRVKELQKQFPNMGFVSININDNPEKFWKKIIYQYNFNLDNEYRFENPKDALETLAVNYLYKVIIVDDKANIIHPNANIFSKDFETTIEDLIQKKELVLK